MFKRDTLNDGQIRNMFCNVEEKHFLQSANLYFISLGHYSSGLLVNLF